MPRRRAAFTLIELIVTTTVIVVIAAIVAPKMLGFRNRGVYAGAHELAGHIKMARDLATATRRRTWVDFDTSAESYSVYIEHPDNPGRAHRVWVTHPVTGGNFQVVLGTGDAIDAAISSAAFGGRSEVEFDSLGQPYNGMGQALTSDGTVVLANGDVSRSVVVTRQTGMVREQ